MLHVIYKVTSKVIKYKYQIKCTEFNYSTYEYL